MEVYANELRLLSKLQHKYVIKLNEAFETPENLFFVTDFYAGGDLFDFASTFDHYRLGENLMKFYGAEILLELEHIHSQRIIFRDLKLENIMIDRNGHIKIVDFGGSIECCSPEGVKGPGGTIPYSAPEIALGKHAYGFEADYWSFGVAIFVLTEGEFPFDGEDKSEYLLNVYSTTISFDDSVFSPECRDLCEKLLEINLIFRLGSSLLNGMDGVKKHEFFSGIEWDKYESWVPHVRCIPILNSDDDTSKFADDFTRLPVHYQL
ncbi:Non-specific serine/threonine protein kinase [Nowakowskiella sp. JEL0407]|nr:Non-specific serine/threonine protein kinase [Nowakowskiella sp. JEL0407]